MYILLTQTKTVTCYMIGPSCREGGRQNLVMSPKGAERRDGLTD